MDVEALRRAMMDTKIKGLSTESLSSTGSVEREVIGNDNNNITNTSTSGRDAPVNLFRDIGEIPSKSGKKRKNRESMTPEELSDLLNSRRGDSSSDEELREINTPPPGKKRRKVTVKRKGGKKRKTRRKKSKPRRKSRRKKKTKKGGKRRTRKKRGKGKKRKRDKKSSGEGSSSGSSSKKNTTRKKQKTDYEVDDCAVCLEPLIGNLENYCNRHQFHRECYRELIRRNVNRCPNCRGQGTQLTIDRLRDRLRETERENRLREEYDDPQIQTYDPEINTYADGFSVNHYPHQAIQTFTCAYCQTEARGVESQGPLTWGMDAEADWMCPDCMEYFEIPRQT